VPRSETPLTHRTATEPIEPGVVSLPIAGRDDWTFYETYGSLPSLDEQPAGTYVVVDTINFSTTVAWLFDRGVDTVTPLADESAADAFAAADPDALVGGDYAFRVHEANGESGLVRNSPTACVEMDVDWVGRRVGLHSINGANAVRAVRPDAPVAVVSPVNAHAAAEWLREREPIHFVAAGTRGEHAVEDTFGVYRLITHLLTDGSPAMDAMHLRLLDHIYANAAHLDDPPDMHPDQYVVRAFDSLSVVPVRTPGEESLRLA
jgi:phosphosulfolactate phosphohydrolase-like enzyme